MGTFTIRNATPQDTGLIYGFILKMARYEKLESEVDTSEEALRRALFDERQAEVVIGEENGIPVGFALFFHNFPPSADNVAYILRTFSSTGSTGGKVTAKHCCCT